MRKVLTCAVVFLVLLGFAGVAAAQLTVEQSLGRKLFFDARLSKNKNQSCATCHAKSNAFTDPDQNSPVSEGSVAGLFGGRSAPSAAYAAFSPFFFWNAVDGLYMGGQFWDGRANTLADQAAGPPLNPVEMALPNKAAAVRILAKDPLYVILFLKAYNVNLARALFSQEGIELAYSKMAKAIGEYEKARMFNRFDSKFDYYRAGLTALTPQEANGELLFNDPLKGNCAACHPTVATLAPDGTAIPPLLTNFSYDNIGFGKNMNIPAYIADPTLVDLGLGGRPDIAAKDPNGEQLGKFKVMGLRNVAVTAPYGHNGIMKTLKQWVHYYNTRDILGPPCIDNNDPGFGVTCWPAPEVPQNVNNTELGNLGLTDAEEDDIVAFLNTLTDGYVDPVTGLPPGVLQPVTFPPMP